MMILTDNETRVDMLNNCAIANTIVKLIDESEGHPISIGVHGDWGAGKSSILAMIEEQFPSKKTDTTVCIRFNGWKHQGFEDSKIALFTYWNGDKESLLAMKNNAIEAYVRYCDTILRNYFGAIKKNLHTQWDDKTSKLLSVIAINGFIIALTRQLSVNGVRDFDF